MCLAVYRWGQEDGVEAADFGGLNLVLMYQLVDLVGFHFVLLIARDIDRSWQDSIRAVTLRYDGWLHLIGLALVHYFGATVGWREK